MEAAKKNKKTGCTNVRLKYENHDREMNGKLYLDEQQAAAAAAAAATRSAAAVAVRDWLMSPADFKHVVAADRLQLPPVASYVAARSIGHPFGRRRAGERTHAVRGLNH